MKAKLYGVGVGPGDPRLMTLLAVDVLKNADEILVPDTGGDNTALNIARPYIEGKEILYCPMPMTRDKQLLERSHRETARLIADRLNKGKSLAFITLGDPTVYSTYMYVHRLVADMGFECEIINGIPSFCAAAGRLGISLCDGSEPLHIIPSSYSGSEGLLDLPGNKVLMKSGKSMASVLDALREREMLGNAQMAERCFMEGEALYRDLSDLRESSYFSVIIVKEKD